MFSSGWEWGYWQTDAAMLRMSWERPPDARGAFETVLAPHGDAVVDAITEHAEVQRQTFIERPLAGWISSRDVLMELGYDSDIVSQPRRPDFDVLAALDAAGQQAQRDAVIQPLLAYADHAADTAAILEDTGSDDRFLPEMVDGLRVDRHRARFMATLVDAVLTHAGGGDAQDALQAADAELDAARIVVDRRHADLHDGPRLIEEQENPTIYQYGYLFRAEELCFWQRERAQVRNIVNDEGLSVPGCAL